MLFTNRLLLVGVLSVGISAASTAQAGSQLFEGSWTVKAFGNEITGGTFDSEFYFAYGIPLGIQCHPNQPRCPFESTPTSGKGNFDPLGGYRNPLSVLYCAPWVNWGGGGATARPAKGSTLMTGGINQRLIPPLYRNPAFFTSGGQPHTTSCTAISTGATPGGKGLVQAGRALTGTISAVTTGTGRGGFSFPAASTASGGIRGTRVGDRPDPRYPYIYSYTYATLRNASGLFGPGQGPGSFSLPYELSNNRAAKVAVKQGPARFGGTMRMLGQLTSKSCYFRNGGCSLDSLNWRYDAIGAAAYTSGGVVTRGYIAYNEPRYCTTLFGTLCYGGTVQGARFPWTTGSVTVTAISGYFHNTVEYAKGYDNRTPTSGRGTIQLVSPTLTRWYYYPPFIKATAGIGILRLKFIPEPQTWAMLVAGASLLGVTYRIRGH